MRKLWGRLVCRWKGHLRGVRVNYAGTPKIMGPLGDILITPPPLVYKCPRCDATWSRKQRKKAAA